MAMSASPTSPVSGRGAGHDPSSPQQQQLTTSAHLIDDEGAPQVLDPYQRALRARMINIAAARFEPRETEWDSDEEDMREVYKHAKARIARKQDPKVLLVMARRFQTAALAVCLQRFGCKTVICHDGAEAYSRYLRRTPHDFDMCIADWDLPGVGGRDLAFYERERGGRLCFVAAIPASMKGVDALRGGAHIFLRRPLVIHMHVLRELLLPNVRSSYGYPTELMKTGSRAPELRLVLDSIAMNADADTELLLDEVRAELEEEDDSTIDANLTVVSKLVDMMKEAAKEAEGDIDESDEDDDDCSTTDAGSDAGRRSPRAASTRSPAKSVRFDASNRSVSPSKSQRHARSPTSKRKKKPSKKAQQAAMEASSSTKSAKARALAGAGMSQAQIQKVMRALTSSLVTFNAMKHDISRLQLEVRELKARQLQLPEDTYPYHADIMNTPVKDMDNVSRVAAIEALKRARRHLFTIEHENAQLNADMDRLTHFRVELEDGFYRGGINVNFVEAPEISVPVPAAADDAWRGNGNGGPPLALSPGRLQSPRGGTGEWASLDGSPLLSPNGSQRPVDAKTAKALDVLRNRKSMSVSQLQDALATLKKRPKAKEHPMARLLAMNQALEARVMVQEDNAGVQLQKVVPVSGLNIPLPDALPNCPTKSDPTPVDELYDATARGLLAIGPVANEFMARLMASHPMLHSKCEAFIRAMQKAIETAAIVERFEALRTWVHKRNARELEELRVERAERAKALAAVKQMKSSAALATQLQGLMGRVTRMMSLKLYRGVMERYYGAWKQLAIGAVNERKRRESMLSNSESESLNQSVSGLKVVTSPTLSSPRELSTAETRLLGKSMRDSGRGDSNGGGPDRTAVLQRYRKELAQAQKELEEVREEYRRVARDRNDLAEKLREADSLAAETKGLLEDRTNAAKRAEAYVLSLRDEVAQKVDYIERISGELVDARAELGAVREELHRMHANGGKPEACERYTQASFDIAGLIAEFNGGGSRRTSAAAAANSSPRAGAKQGKLAAGRASSVGQPKNPAARDKPSAEKSAAAAKKEKEPPRKALTGTGTVEPFKERRQPPKDGDAAATASAAPPMVPAPPPAPPAEGQQRPPSRPVGGATDAAAAEPLNDTAATVETTTATTEQHEGATTESKGPSLSASATFTGIAIPDGIATAVVEPLGGTSGDAPAAEEEDPSPLGPPGGNERRKTQAPTGLLAASGFEINVTSATPVPTDHPFATPSTSAATSGRATPVAMSASEQQRHDAATEAAAALLGDATAPQSQPVQPSQPPPPPDPAELKRQRKAAEKERRKKAAAERAAAHAARLRAARLGIRNGRSAAPSAAVSRRASVALPMMAGGSGASTPTPAIGAELGSGEHGTGTPPRAQSPAKLVLAARKFGSPEEAGRALKQLRGAAAKLRDSAGVTMHLELPSAASNPDVMEVLFEVMRALSVAADAAAAGVVLPKRHHNAPGSPTGGTSASGSPVGPGGRPRVPKLPDIASPSRQYRPEVHSQTARPQPGGSGAQASGDSAGSRWRTMRDGRGAFGNANRSALTGAFTARTPGQSKGYGGPAMLPPVRR